MSGPSSRERGLSGPVAAGLIFRNELPRHAPVLPHIAQTLNYPVGPSAYSDGWSGHMVGQSAHTAGRSAYLTGRSGAEFFEEDCYPNPHPSQLNVLSYPAAPQHHTTTFQTHGVSVGV
jgi:hypothetical protein